MRNVLCVQKFVKGTKGWITVFGSKHLISYIVYRLPRKKRQEEQERAWEQGKYIVTLYKYWPVYFAQEFVEQRQRLAAAYPVGFFLFHSHKCEDMFDFTQSPQISISHFATGESRSCFVKKPIKLGRIMFWAFRWFNYLANRAQTYRKDFSA